MSALNPPTTRSWRDIPQPVKTDLLGREGKKRLFISIANVVALVLALVATGWGVYKVISMWETNPASITAPTKGVPIRDVVVRTDGVLDKAWAQRTLELPKTASLMELDLVTLKNLLEASGQVSKAVIERRFPDVLAVTLQERTPVARIMAVIGEAAPVSFMVARDGMVYSGFGYDPAMVGGLPYIDGVKLLREGFGFARIEGMESVADLLGTAQVSAPELYRSFRIVSLARFALDRTLAVKSTDVELITFGASQDSFYRQIARLDYILEETRRQNVGSQLKSVNLAIGDKQVPVSFEPMQHEPARKTSVSARPVFSTGLSFFPTPSRNSSPSQRDF